MLSVYKKNKKVNKDYKLGDAMKEAKKTWDKVKGGEELPDLEGGKKDEMKDEMKSEMKDEMKKGGFEPAGEPIYGLSPANVDSVSTPKATGGKSQKRKAEKTRKTRKNKSQKRSQKK